MTIRFAAGLMRTALTPVDNRFILDYLPHANPLHTAVYLYGLMQCSHPETAEPSLCEALGLTAEAVTEAYAYWQQQGLVRIKSDKPLIVEYLALDPSTAKTVLPGKYMELVNAINQLTAPRQFDARELNHVFDWIEVYGLDEGAVLELVSHCMDTRGRRVSVNYMDTVAEAWSGEGVTTRGDALAYVERYQLKKHGASEILRQWNRRRKPTRPEMALYDKWTGEWGFTPEAILAALPRLTTAGTPNFTYLDEQLEELMRKDRRAASDILESDAADASERAFARLVFERAGKVETATKTQRAQISMYVDTLKMPRELLLYGAEQCRGSNEPFGLMKKIWNDWHDNGIDTIEKAEAWQREHAGAGGVQKKPPRKRDYAQHDLSDEQLNSLLIDLDKDL